jgi:hypothetical protein
MPQFAKCTTCQAPVIFVKSAANPMKSVILNAEPDPTGNTVIIDGQAKVDTGDMYDVVPADLPRYKSHWATCPQAAEWRQKQKDRKNKGMK